MWTQTLNDDDLKDKMKYKYVFMRLLIQQMAGLLQMNIIHKKDIFRRSSYRLLKVDDARAKTAAECTGYGWREGPKWGIVRK